jgi:biotin/methionine sulfoxide reductase
MGDRKRTKHQTLTHWGAYEVESAAGTVTRVHRFSADPDPSPIGYSMVDVDKCRVRMPSVRKSWLEGGPGTAPERRGSEEFVEVGWDHALDLVAGELDRVRDAYGNEAIYAGSYGWGSAGRFHHTQSQIHRFANSIGGYTRSVNTYSLAAAEVILPHVIGMDWWEFENSHTSWDVIGRETELIVAFGGIPLKNSQVQYGGVGQHNLRGWLARWADRGTRFINVSPIADDLPPSVGPEWLPIRPGTDTALMLALIHTLVIEDSYDRNFVNDYCVGWDSLVRHVTGDDDGVVRDAEWASSITSIAAEEIRSLARSLVRHRSLITVSWSIQRADHGEHAIWAAIALAAAVGQIGVPGGGFGIGYGAVATIGNGIGKTWLPRFEQGTPAVDSFIPVARIADMLLHPGEAFTYDGASYTYPDIKLVYWAGGNPFHHHQDLNRLRRAWQRPDTIVVNEPFWTATARHADIIFPATTVLERNDIGGAPNDAHLFAMQQAIAPVGGARNDYEIFTELARRLGAAEIFTEGRTSDEWVKHLYGQLQEAEPDTPPFEEFWAAGFLDRRPAGADSSRVLLRSFRHDPSANPLATPSGKIELYSEAVASFGYEDCPPHPTWLEPREWLGNATDTHDLHLITNQPKTRLHSQWDHGVTSRNAKVAGLEAMRIHPDDAATRGISDGDAVRVSNSRGACLAGATVSSDVRQGVVELPTGAWYSPDSDGTCLHGNPNTLTSDAGTSSLARGPAAQTCLVQVEKWREATPQHTAFEPPRIVALDQ